MADGFDDTTATDDWDIDDLLKEFEPEVEEAEKKADESTARLAKSVKKIAERQAKAEERERVEKLTSEFYAKASEDERELADLLLAGVSDEGRVKKMLDLAKAKAQAMNKSSEEEKEEAEEEDSARAFSPPIAGAPPSPKDPWEPLLERARQGDTHASFLEYMADDLAFPMGKRR